MYAGRRPLAQLLEEGRTLFNAGRFFEAHERWEEAWLVETGPTKLLLQGLIQIAAGFLKANQGRGAAAVRLLAAGAQKVADAGVPPGFEDFLAEVRRRAEASGEGAPGTVSGPFLPAFEA